MCDENQSIEVKDHLDKPKSDQCTTCSKFFKTNELKIEKEINATHYYFCSEECLDKFKEQELWVDEEED